MLRIYPRHLLRLSPRLILECLFAHRTGKKKSIDLFERAFADYIGVRYAAAVPSGRIGMAWSLSAFNFKEGDEVIIPAYAFPGVVVAVASAGLKPVFVDIKETDCTINESLIEEKISRRTVAIVAIHMFGFPCNLDKIMYLAGKYKLKVFEDVAHACGAKYRNSRLGSFGDCGVYSFAEGKNLPCLGGGLVATNDQRCYKKIKEHVARLTPLSHLELSYRLVSSCAKYLLLSDAVFSFITFPLIFALGALNINYVDSLCNDDGDVNKLNRSFKENYAFSDFQALVGTDLLGGLDAYNALISENARVYDQLISKKVTVRLDPETDSRDALTTRYYYVIRAKNRDIFRKRLLGKGIDTKADDMSYCPEWDPSTRGAGYFPVAKKATRENLEIPNNGRLKEKDLQYISEYVNLFAV